MLYVFHDVENLKCLQKLNLKILKLLFQKFLFYFFTLSEIFVRLSLLCSSKFCEQLNYVQSFAFYKVTCMVLFLHNREISLLYFVDAVVKYMCTLKEVIPSKTSWWPQRTKIQSSRRVGSSIDIGVTGLTAMRNT